MGPNSVGSAPKRSPRDARLLPRRCCLAVPEGPRAALCAGSADRLEPSSLSPDLVAQRGEKLELLIDKTENLVDSVSLSSGVAAAAGRLPAQAGLPLVLSSSSIFWSPSVAQRLEVKREPEYSEAPGAGSGIN